MLPGIPPRYSNGHDKGYNISNDNRTGGSNREQTARGGTPVNLGTPTVSDICDANPAVTNNAPPAGFPLGNTTVTWTVRDASGNSATATQV